MRFCSRGGLLVVLIVAQVVGCGPRTISPPRTVPVSGMVMFDGKPAAGVLVKFHPQFDIGQIKFIPLGETGPDGTFTLSTGAPGNGAPAGEYVVTFQKLRIESDTQNSGIEMKVDEWNGRFKDPDKSSWKVTVGSGSSLEPFQLK